MYHALNRAVGGATVLETLADDAAFEKVSRDANEQIDIGLLAFCLMPNHWHPVLWPREDGDLSEDMRWLTNTHTHRWRLAHGTGPLHQGRFKSFSAQEEEHSFAVCRYAERNALRATLVAAAEQWRWSSLWHRVNAGRAVPLAEWPRVRGEKWLEYVSRAETEAELKALRRSAWHGDPFGQTVWPQVTANRLGREATLRSPGPPPRISESPT